MDQLFRTGDYAAVSQSILRYANRGTTRIEFLTGVSTLLLEFSGCDALQLWLQDSDLRYQWELAVRPGPASRFTVVGGRSPEPRRPPESAAPSRYLEKLRDTLRGRFDRKSWCSTKKGSSWTGGPPPAPGADGAPYPSVALMRFKVDEHAAGLLQLQSLRRKYFTRKKVEFYEGIAEILGLAIANQRAQWALGERVKELTCLYGIGRIAQLSGIALDEALQRIVDLLPPAWQFPEIACARLLLDGRAFATAGFREGPHRQAADLTIHGKLRGRIEIVYPEERPEFAEGPFLPEERSLIDNVAREVALIVERREAEASQSMLQAQLRHADRLATIGQLAAGVAHELNEPLGSILGFAQLVQKDLDLPDRAAKDVARIVKAALRAREVIHKLLVFSRQKTPVKARVDLNRIVEEGLYFLESRCATAGIRLSLALAPDLPRISADASQLHQVLVNLVVNSMQAMPEGGSLRIETCAGPEHVSLIVRDTGAGISDEIMEKIFTPFFTTKDVDQGTGLGLAVVHGIVTSHGGSIRVESAPGQGARFEIRFPPAEPDAST